MDDDDAIILEDWKMTKDRIKHFDDILMRTRTQGLPIAAIIQGIGFFTKDRIGDIQISFAGINTTVFPMIILAGLLYLIPIVTLDILHFKLLLLSVDRAKEIEELPKFKNKLKITHVLTNRGLSILHATGAYAVYGLIFIFGILYLVDFVF